ncbi:MAG: hypothetical protein BMS9Abin15_1106 [Gammaproteobacteria bacterium]|nr:MAG: hypothetical protein BMS9Abin15_1106 [Gammaproteobacteria bacterium]
MRYFLLTFLILLLLGCVPGSDNPLTDPDKEKIDLSLLGTWYWKDENESGYIHIGLDEKTKLLRIIMSEFNKDGNLKSSELYGHTSSLQGNNYLNLRWVRQEQAENAGYLFIKYTVGPDSLGIALMNNGMVKEAIKAGSLKGKINEGRWSSSAYITEDQSKLRKFVLRNDKELFPEMKYLPRLKLPNQQGKMHKKIGGEQQNR